MCRHGLPSGQCAVCIGGMRQRPDGFIPRPTRAESGSIETFEEQLALGREWAQVTGMIDASDDVNAYRAYQHRVRALNRHLPQSLAEKCQENTIIRDLRARGLL